VIVERMPRQMWNLQNNVSVVVCPRGRGCAKENSECLGWVSGDKGWKPGKDACRRMKAGKLDLVEQNVQLAGVGEQGASV
jgi:hypothetical protein